VAILAPHGEEYTIKNLFQGYVDREVLDQVPYELSKADIRGDASDVGVILERVELTERGGGIEYLRCSTRVREVNLGFSLCVVDSETGEVSNNSPGLETNGGVLVSPGESVSLGRTSGIVDADGNSVAGTFEGGAGLRLQTGAEVALLDSSGAAANIIPV
jgi:hypothetical protein